MKKILVVGQTPPPFGGQALMTQILLNGNYDNVILYHIRLSFSKDFDDMGAFKFYKFWALVKTIFLIWYYRFSKNITILYYAPAGPNKLAMLRDMILLSTTRILFNKLILHTHAGGTSILYNNLNFIFKYFYRLSFFKPNILIKLTEYSHGDEFVLKPIKTVIIPNGIEDNYINFRNNNIQHKDDFINLLYVGAMYKERGIIDLILAVKLLLNKGYKVKLNLVGIFIENIFEKQIHKLINENNLITNIDFYGTKIDNGKWDVFLKSDIFCFPSYVPSETFGLVLVEAMQFKLPIVATNWNGIPYVIENNFNALLVNVNKPEDIANKIEFLILNPNLRKEFAENGRILYLKKYSLKVFENNMNQVFNLI